jgi:CRP/FNR family transcriptional regulator, cyclic AMP receptor protein
VRSAIPSSQSPPAAGPAPGAPHITQAAIRLADAVVDVPPGPWSPTPPAGTGSPFAALLVEGLVLRELELCGVPAAQIVGAEEFFDPYCPHDCVLQGERVAWRAVEPSRVAVLGAGFVAATGRWPALAYALQRRQTEQAHRAARGAAISQLPRVEDRVLALFRTLAEDRGRVCTDGIRVALPVTHECLGRLIGARRPTVSLALRGLAADGLLRRRDGDWLLSVGATRLGGGPALEEAA